MCEILRLLGPTQRCLTFEVGVHQQAATELVRLFCPAVPESKLHSEHCPVMASSHKPFGVLASSRPAGPCQQSAVAKARWAHSFSQPCRGIISLPEHGGPWEKADYLHS